MDKLSSSRQRRTSPFIHRARRQDVHCRLSAVCLIPSSSGRLPETEACLKSLDIRNSIGAVRNQMSLRRNTLDFIASVLTEVGKNRATVVINSQDDHYQNVTAPLQQVYDFAASLGLSSSLDERMI